MRNVYSTDFPMKHLDNEIQWSAQKLWRPQQMFIPFCISHTSGFAYTGNWPWFLPFVERRWTSWKHRSPATHILSLWPELWETVRRLAQGAVAKSKPFKVKKKKKQLIALIFGPPWFLLFWRKLRYWVIENKMHELWSIVSFFFNFNFRVSLVLRNVPPPL